MPKHLFFENILNIVQLFFENIQNVVQLIFENTQNVKCVLQFSSKMFHRAVTFFYKGNWSHKYIFARKSLGKYDKK